MWSHRVASRPISHLLFSSGLAAVPSLSASSRSSTSTRPRCLATVDPPEEAESLGGWVASSTLTRSELRRLCLTCPLCPSFLQPFRSERAAAAGTCSRWWTETRAVEDGSPLVSTYGPFLTTHLSCYLLSDPESNGHLTKHTIAGLPQVRALPSPDPGVGATTSSLSSVPGSVSHPRPPLCPFSWFLDVLCGSSDLFMTDHRSSALPSKVQGNEKRERTEFGKRTSNTFVPSIAPIHQVISRLPSARS